MGRHKTKTVLKKVFRDITNLSDVIEDSKKVGNSLKRTNFDDKDKTDKLIQDTKIIIECLKLHVVKISNYFNENYNAWQDNASKDVDNEIETETSEIYASDAEIINTTEKPNEASTVENVEDSCLTSINGAVTDEVGNVEKIQSDNVNNEVRNETSDIQNEQSGDVTKNSRDNSVNVQSNSVDAIEDSVEANSMCLVEETNHVNIDQSCEDETVPEQDTNEVNENIEDVDTSDIKKESKVFLKCIDINKLKHLPGGDGKDDSVLVISDSEPEKGDAVGRRHSVKKSKKKKDPVDLLAAKISNEITISKIRRNMSATDDDIEIVESESTDKIVKILANHLLKSNAIQTYIPKKKTMKDPLKITGRINVDSASTDSDGSHVRAQLSRAVQKLPKPSQQEACLIDAINDKKFGYTAYVALPRYSCDRLKELYLNKMEHNELKRLTNLRNLKKRKRDRYKGSDSCSDTGKKKRTKSKRCSSKDSHISNSSGTGCSDIEKEKLPDNGSSVDPTAVILNDANSATDISSGNDEKNKKKKKSKHSSRKTFSDEESSDSKKKRKWHKDKLLNKKVINSDSDSGDSDEKQTARNEIRKRLSKRKTKKAVVTESSSESDSTKKSKHKKKSGSNESSSSSNSSSSDSDSADNRRKKDAPKAKKGGRIKRIKNSSSDDDDDKTTRKSIRRVKGDEELKETTKQAEKEEKERKARITERQKKYNAIFDSDKLADSTVEKVVLDFSEDSKEELLSVDTDLVAKLKPHQAKGIQFMWDACYESLKRTKKTSGSGCILAHCMGLGKTLQVIALIHTLMGHSEKTGVRKVMVVCPLNTVLNWVDEFQKWLDDLDGDEIEVYELVSNKQNSYRQHLVKQWAKHGGVLIIGYDMFRTLTNPTNKRLNKKTREVFHTEMVDPGPDLIICDEGHLLKNEKTNLNVAISRVRTVRRIVLTGTPMQNNLKEYYCMVQFVKPNLLGTYKEYLNRFVNPITNGQYTDSTPHDISVMKKRSHVLHKMLDGVVQRKDYGVLAPFLPPKYEYVVFTKLSEVQIQLYQYYLDNLARRPVDSKLRKTTFLFSDFQVFQRICTHPKVMQMKSVEDAKRAMFVESEEESEGSLKDFIDDKSEKSSSSTSSSSSSSSDSDSGSKGKDSTEVNSKKKKTSKRLTRTSAAAAGIEIAEITDEVIAINDEWWQNIVDGNELENIALGGKIYLLFEILQQCELIGDKILIFSQSLYSLNVIEYFLGKIDEATQDGKNETVCGFSGSWAQGLDYFRIDGSSSCDNRAAWCKSFNNPDNLRARLFLISTKAGGLGINLVGANRVIIFDVSWNPSHDTQSIYRIYRFGQTKPCYIYRFCTWGTMEMKIYERQVTKLAISKRVIDEQQIDRHYNQDDLAELYNFEPRPVEAPTPLIPKDVLLTELLQKEKDRIYKYHEHHSLLENKEEEELDEAERKAAWEEYEYEKTKPAVSSVPANLGQWIRNLPEQSVRVALLNIVQRDNPVWSREQVQAVVPIVIQQLREQVEKGEELLYNRVVSELKIMQVQQQQKLQQYYLQQQMKLLQQQQQQFLVASAQNQRTAGDLKIATLLNAALSKPPKPMNSNEIVELND